MKSTTLLCLLGISVFLLAAGCNTSSQKEGNSSEDTDKFAANIRETEFQSPEEERKGFKLPPGFEITLFASEPDISKPINMEFDNQGRLWVTSTVEYPMPAAPGRGHDRIIILEDTDNDGKADIFTPFVDSLNIPIGITPIHQGAIAYSIPNVYKFIDHNGDGKADETTKLLGPFEFADTHGMVNNLIRGYDGWIYACHGYANNSTVAGSDGDSIHMNSGNTFRFREDGSRVEATTLGRINPFGYAYDEWGYLYSLDCHTKPIYQLISGAQYPAQGIKEPAIGWAPEMMSYEFGSTANSGLVYYTGSQFPEPYRHNFFSGNVVTSRINRNTMSLNGSSPVSRREEDFLISEDPWFRPVDIKTGPDGSLYIADFYNKIIGHYEVPKDHPQRDRTSGRIWKISYIGNKDAPEYTAKNWSKAPLGELVKALDYPQLNIRMMIANCLTDVYGQKAIAPVQQMMSEATNSTAFIQGLWVLYRLNALPESILTTALQHSEPIVQVHGLRVLAEQQTINAGQRALVLNALNNKNPQVRRMAVAVLGCYPAFSYLQPLIDIYNNAAEQDTHLKYMAILGIKDHLNNSAILQQVKLATWTEGQLAVLMNVIPEVPSKEAAYYALNYLQTHPATGKKLADRLQYIARYIQAGKPERLISIATRNAAGNMDATYQYFDAVRQGIAQQGVQASASLKNWGIGIAQQFLQHKNDSAYRQIQAAKIAQDYKVMSLEPSMKNLLAAKSADPKARVAAADALLTISAERNLPAITEVFNKTGEVPAVRENLSAILARLQSPAILTMFENALEEAPPALQVSIATILAGSGEGIGHLLRALKNGKVKTDILEELRIKENLTANISPDQRTQLNAMTAGKMGVENRKDLIKARLASFDPSAVTIETGRQVFLNNCSMCHMIDNTGGNIGPKLSGIGTWGAVALTEKILDPNSNISEAFRTYTIHLTNGKSLSGLYRREEGEILIFADLSGQEFPVPKAEIKEKMASKYTLMPDHFRNTIVKKDFDALLKYLLSIKENQ